MTNPFIESKKILLKAQASNTNEWYGQQFQKGLDEIASIKSKNFIDRDNVLLMRSIPQIILSLSEVVIMVSNPQKDPNQVNKLNILRIQKNLWKYHKDISEFDEPDLWEEKW